MKILTIGKGFVSSHLPYEVIDERLTTFASQTRSILEHYKPDVIVNCIGKTGRPNVDWCELHKTETYFGNVVLPAVLAYECEKLNIHMIHMGSGCIYFGGSPNYRFSKDYSIKTDRGWKETDAPNPLSYYSKTKAACDLLLGEMPHVTTLRLRMPISTRNDPRNFINKIRGYKQIINIPNSMTMMSDLVRCVDWAAKESKLGTFHVVNPEPITAVQVMKEYQKYVPEHKFDVITESELDKLTVAKRSNCILDTTKLNQAGFTMTPSKEAIQNCMAEYIKNI